MKNLHTIRTMEMADGSVQKFTLAFIKLKAVKAKWPEAYIKYNEIRNKDELDELDYCIILYIAYLCANTDSEKIMTEDEFLEVLPTHRGKTLSLAIELTYPEKN